MRLSTTEMNQRKAQGIPNKTTRTDITHDVCQPLGFVQSFQNTDRTVPPYIEQRHNIQAHRAINENLALRGRHLQASVQKRGKAQCWA